MKYILWAMGLVSPGLIVFGLKGAAAEMMAAEINLR